MSLAKSREKSEEIRKKLRIVVLDCPYDTIHDPRTRDFLGKIAQFKIESYLDAWTYGVLPVDSGDFIGAHFLLCLETDQVLDIIAGFKILTHDRCRTFRLEFPAIHALTGVPDTTLHHQAIQEQIQFADQAGTSLGYVGSWAIKPEAKRSRLLAYLCRDITTAMLVLGCKEKGIPKAITYAVLRLKVDRYHEAIGLRPLSINNQLLRAFQSFAYMDELLSASLLDTQTFSDEALSTAKEYSDLWENRLEISHISKLSKKIAA